MPVEMRVLAETPASVYLPPAPEEGAGGATLDVLPGPTLDTAGIVRRVRRMTDLSQRDLARRVGVAPSTIARAESAADGRITLQTLIHILAVADLRLVVVDGDDTEVTAFPADTATDNGGRHAPAHLDPYVAGPNGPSHFPMGFTRRKIPRICWHHRRKRGERLDADPCRVRALDHPTQERVGDLWDVHRVRRHLRSQAIADRRRARHR